MSYDHREIDKKWQQKWRESNIDRSSEDKDKKKSYVLDMFPYPSGEGLHVGHPKGYIATDIYSRFKRMNGYSILHPMGWDAFGLPAENYALKHKVHPRVAVEKNIATFKEQLEHIGFNYDWSREINTTDPSYYHWTQWIFLKMFEQGLAFQSNEPINWCPSCMTGLANEDLDGVVCERCGTQVVKKNLPQWVLKITEYADRILTDLDTLDWPEHIKEAQRNWIGRSEGVEVHFALKPEAEPTFYEFLEPGRIKEGVPFVERDAILAIVKHWSEEKYLGLKWKQVDWETFITGGVEAGQTREEAARVEITQETGYKNARLVKHFGKLHSKFFHVPKDQNRFGHFDLFYFELENDEREEMGADEQAIHDVEWLSLDQIKDFKLPASHRYAWECLQKGEEGNSDRVTVFTTRPDTIFGATYLVLAPEHPLVARYMHQASNAIEIDAYVTSAALKTEIDRSAEGKEKTGIQLEGVMAINPATQKEIPVYIADYVLASYGTGAIMAVPAHDQRDQEFAEKMQLPIVNVIESPEELYTGAGQLINSGEFTGRNSEEAKGDIVAFVKGEKVTRYKIRDWVFSRQRYWGEPIPIIHCPKDGAVPVPYEDLPVVLPEVESYEPTGTGESPLAAIDEWVNTTCPKCGGKAKRETNTMPQWAGSSWYYLRFMDPHDDTQLVSLKNEKYWAPVDVYVGGDHAVRHLIYARFWHKFLYDIGVVSTKEPFARLEFLGFILAEDGRKMSKRYGNVINPDDVIAKYGADAFRVYEMFMGPFENTTAWSTASIAGTARFIERLWRMQESVIPEAVPALDALLHETIRKVASDIEAFKFNTAVSQMMVLVNRIEKEGRIGEEQWRKCLRLLAPFAPHVSEELWEKLGETTSIHLASWPEFDESLLISSESEVVVQVNGKRRGVISLASDASESDALIEARKLPNVATALGESEPKRVVYVPGRILNLVVPH